MAFAGPIIAAWVLLAFMFPPSQSLRGAESTYSSHKASSRGLEQMRGVIARNSYKTRSASERNYLPHFFSGIKMPTEPTKFDAANLSIYNGKKTFIFLNNAPRHAAPPTFLGPVRKPSSPLITFFDKRIYYISVYIILIIVLILFRL